MESETFILFHGGQNNGQLWRTRAHLRMLNPIDRWDDNTIAAGLVSPVFPDEQIAVETMYPSWEPESPEYPRGRSLYKFDCECEPSVYRYVFDKFIPKQKDADQ